VVRGVGVDELDSGLEGRESEDGEDEVSQNAQKQEMSMSAPPSPEAVKKEAVKPKKRVHWAF